MQKRVKDAWNTTHHKKKVLLGRRDGIAEDPYVDWVKNRVKTNMLPFLMEAPVYLQYPNRLPQPLLVPIEDFNIATAAQEQLCKIFRMYFYKNKTN